MRYHQTVFNVVVVIIAPLLKVSWEKVVWRTVAKSDMHYYIIIIIMMHIITNLLNYISGSTSNDVWWCARVKIPSRPTEYNMYYFILEMLENGTLWRQDIMAYIWWPHSPLPTPPSTLPAHSPRVFYLEIPFSFAHSMLCEEPQTKPSSNPACSVLSSPASRPSL